MAEKQKSLLELKLISKGLEKIKNLTKVNCEILSSGKTYRKMQFYYCDCDPYQKNSICEECKNICHRGHKITIGPNEGEKYCHCGLKGHKCQEETKETLKYNSRCFFYEFSKKSNYFIYFKNQQINFCAFCYNFCDNYVDIKKSEKIIVDCKEKVMDCDCRGSIHQDIKMIYFSLKEMISRDINSINLSTYQHFINLIFLCKKVFKNLYISLDSKLLSMKQDLAIDNFSFEENFEFSYYNWGLINFAHFLKASKHIYFFTEKIKAYFEPTFVTKLLKFNIDKDNYLTIIFKDNCLIGLYKSVIKEEFMVLSKVSFRDLENLNPFQRYLLLYRSKEVTFLNEKFFPNRINNPINLVGYNLIDEMLDYIDKVVSLPSLNVLIHMPTIIRVVKILSEFVLYDFFEFKQKIIFCKTIEVLLSKHVIKEIKKDQSDKLQLISLLKSLLNVLLAFSFQENDKLFLKAIVQVEEIVKADLFHGKNELSKEASKITILIYLSIMDLTIYESIKKEIKFVMKLSNKILSMMIGYPDCYIYGVKKSINQNLEKFISFINCKPSDYGKSIQDFLNEEVVKIKNLYCDYYLFKNKLQDVYIGLENSINNFLNLVKLKENLSRYPSIFDETVNENQNSKFIFPQITTSNILEVKYSLLKSNYLFWIFDVLKINLRTIENEKKTVIIDSRVPETTMKLIISVFELFVDNSPENSIVIMNCNFVKFFKLYIEFYFESIFNLYYSALKQIINSNYEFSNLETFFEIMDSFVGQIKEDKLKTVFLLKVLKIYEQLVNDFSSFNEKIIKIVRKKIISIENNFPLIKGYLMYLVEQMRELPNIKEKTTIGNTEKLFMKTTSFVDSKPFTEKFLINIDIADKIFTKFMKIVVDIFDDTGTMKYEEFLNNLIKLEHIQIVLSNHSLNLFLRANILRYFRMIYIDISVEEQKVEHYIKQFNINDSFNNKKKKTYEDKIEEIYEFLTKLIHIPDLLKNFDFEYSVLKYEILNLESIIEVISRENSLSSNHELLYYLENGILLSMKVFYNKFLIIIREKKSAMRTKTVPFFFQKNKLNSNQSLINLKNKQKINRRLETLKFQTKKEDKGEIFEILNSGRSENKRMTQVHTLKNYDLKKLNLQILDEEIVVNEANPDKIEQEYNEKLDPMKLGIKSIKFYEIALYFMYLKKRIYEIFSSSIILKNSSNQKEKQENRKITLKSVLGLIENNIDILSMETDEVENGMTDEFLQMHQTKTQLLLNLENINEKIQQVQNDIDFFQNEHFELFDQIKISSMFDNNFNSLVMKNKSKSMINLFEKKDNELKIKMNILEKKIKEGENRNEKLILKFILDYEIEKKNIDKGSFLQILNEINYNFDCSYRKIFIDNIFKTMDDDKLMEKFKKEILSYLLKLLQYDTKNTQMQILKKNYYSIIKNDDLKASLDDNKDNEKEKKEKMKILLNKFIINLLSVIYYSYNPSSNKLNFEYFYALHILKVLKYYCEEHNETFQTLFYQTEMGDINSIKFTFIDFLLMALNKIILISNWDLSQNIREDDLNYFYDIFQIIVEFLIETVQGAKAENLKFFDHRDSKLMPFIKSIKTFLLYNKSDLQIIYQVKNDIFSLILSIIEEKNSPEKIASNIAMELLPKKIINNLKMILKKLYIKFTNFNNLDLSDFKKIKFNKKIYEYFLSCYYDSEELLNSEEFKLSLKMYEFFKILASKYQIKDAVLFTNYLEEYTDRDIEDMTDREFFFARFFPFFKTNNSEKEINRFTKEKINLIENYYILKLFDEIIKTIKIKIDDNEVCSVFFSINPLCRLISNNTMQEFYENVNRETRYTKLFDLMQYCDSFFNEIEFNLRRAKASKINKVFNKLNYYWIQAILFLLSLIINLLLLISLDSNHEEMLLHGNQTYYSSIFGLAIVQIFINLVILIIWFYSRYPLYHGVEYKKYISVSGIPDEKLSLWAKFKIAIIYSIVLKSEIICSIIIIILAILGIYRPSNSFCFGLQLLTVINLSDTLKDIMQAIKTRWSQLLITFSFMIFMIYCYALVGFYFLNEIFGMTEYDGKEIEENLCQNLIQCILTHIDFGLRLRGGIGDIIRMLSFTNLPLYLMKFFYSLIFYLLVIVLLLNMVFGIIIGAFAELREISSKIETDKRDVCFICGAKRDEIEKDGVHFGYHVEEEHNYLNYIYYIIGLKFEDFQNLDKINSFAYENIQNKSIIWIPDYKKKRDNEIKEEKTG